MFTLKLLIKDYAEAKGITTQAVYKAVKVGKLQMVEENGHKYIIANEEELKKSNENLEVEVLKRENQILKEYVEDLRKDKEVLNQRLNELEKRLQESNIIQIKTIEALNQLEHKQQKLSWIEKIFRK